MEHRILAGHDIALRRWDRGGIRPVLALHCSLAHGGAWAGLAERLAGIDMIAPDLPGHGESADWQGDDLHGLTTRIAIQLATDMAAQAGMPVDLFGHSFGGTVALRVALERPDLVRSLMLAEPVVFAAARDTSVWQDFTRAQQMVGEAMRACQPEQAAALFHGLWGTGIPLDRLPERQRRYIIDRMRLVSVLDPDLVDDRRGLLSPGGLERLAVPVLLAEGADSPPIVGAINGALAARLPSAHRARIDGARHMMPLTHAAQLAPFVQAHLETAG